MNLNRKLKAAVAAALAAVMLISAFVVIPAAASGDGTAPSAVTHGEGSARNVDRSVGLTSADASEAIADIDQILDADPPSDGTQAPDSGAVDPATPNDADPATPDEATAAPAEEPQEPGKVTHITRTDPAEDAIALEWNSASGAQGYHVYWRSSDAKDAGYTLLSSLKDTTLTIRNLKKGAMYDFKVTAYRTEKGGLIDGEGATLTAGTMPTPVENFRLTSGVATGTVLKWDKNELCDGYMLYRQFDGVWSRYRELPRDIVSFTDSAVVAGRAYNYRLCTFRRDSSGLLESSPALVRTICGLCAPGDNGSASLLRRMYFKWKKNPYATGYEIRLSQDNKNFELLADTASASYTTDRLTDGQHYYFRIYPYRTVAVGNEKVRVYGTYLAKDLTVTNSAYGKAVPATYIEVSLDRQHMWYYIDGKLYVSTDVVTGNYNSMDTPKGYWSVNSKASPCTLVGADYTSYVNYWMAFIGGGYGIHDASWRSSYGGTIYKGNGSHGCINTPYDAVKKMYAKVTIGTPVIVY